MDLSCKFEPLDDGDAEVQLIAGEMGLGAGRYEFDLLGTNPREASVNRDGEDTTCGMTHCWTFRSLQVAVEASSPELDARMSTVSFAINERMPDASLPLLSRTVRDA